MKILILFAHPRFEKSRINRALLKNIATLPRITVHDLYEEYPDFNIDVDREKALLLDHDILVWQHPFYVYGAPAILKQWVDMVLEYGWAHGKNGDKLKGKIIFNTLTAGGTKDTYAEGSQNGCTIRQFLIPFEQTARLCKMTYIPPFVVHGTYLLMEKDIEHYRQLYHKLLNRLALGDYNVDTLLQCEYLNDWLALDDGRNIS